MIDALRDAERQILSRALRDIDFVRTASPVLSAYDFTPNNKNHWVWGKIADSVKRLGELPTKDFWVRWAIEEFDEDTAHMLVKSISGMLRTDPVAPMHALDMIEKYAVQATVESVARDVLDNLEDGDAASALESMRVGLQRVDSTNIPEYATPLSEAAGYLAEMRSPNPGGLRFRTGVDGLDNVLGGGIPPGKLVAFIATTHTGKSAFVTGLAARAAELTPDSVVVLVTTEETKKDRIYRLYGWLTEVDRSDYLIGSVTDSEIEALELMLDKKSSVMGRISVFEIPPKSPVQDVVAIAQRVRSDHPDKQILVVVDSPDHLVPGGWQESHRLGQSDVWWSLLGMVHNHRLAPISCVVTTQAPKTLEGKRSPKLGDVSETYDKSRTADAVAFLIPGDGDVEAVAGDGFKLVEVIVRKNRCSPHNNVSVVLAGHFGTCRFTEIDYGDIEELEG